MDILRVIRPMGPDGNASVDIKQETAAASLSKFPRTLTLIIQGPTGSVTGPTESKTTGVSLREPIVDRCFLSKSRLSSASNGIKMGYAAHMQHLTASVTQIS
jgi:hypothetical protein